MPVYFLCGGLGSGKSLMAVSRMAAKLERGLPVATNINLDLARLVESSWPAPVVYRLPDFPSGDDLYALGEVPQGGNEDQNGLVVLDEAGLYLNARDWNDKGRRHGLEWFLHSRKLGWDVILLTQSFGMVDRQIRESIGEYVVTMRRWDRMMIPLIGKLGRAFTFGLWSGKLPRLHTAAVMYGQGQSAMHADTWHLRGTELFGAYQTKQKFSRTYEPGLYQMRPGSSNIESFGDAIPDLARPPVAKSAPVMASGPVLKPQLPIVRAIAALPPAERTRWARRALAMLDNAAHGHSRSGLVPARSGPGGSLSAAQ